MLCLLLGPVLLLANPGNKVKFHNGNLSTAKTLAAQEGKLYFAEFTASWCAPCRILEETTFSEPSVIDYISKNYIAVKVDIDNFDGIALKQVYNVQTIPTIIVFNSKGELLEKYDKSLPTSKMLALLKKHNLPKNKVKTASKPTPSAKPNTNKPPISSAPSTSTNTTSSSSPTKVNPSHSPMRPASNTVSRPDKKPVNPTPVPDATPTKPVPQGDGLYRFRVTTQPSKGFSVQIGAFKEYGNVLREVERIQDKFEQPILVHIVKRGEASVYKIMIGEFVTRQKAIQFRTTLNNKGLEGVIKDLSTLK